MNPPRPSRRIRDRLRAIPTRGRAAERTRRSVPVPSERASLRMTTAHRRELRSVRAVGRERISTKTSMPAGRAGKTATPPTATRCAGATCRAPRCRSNRLRARISRSRGRRDWPARVLQVSGSRPTAVRTSPAQASPHIERSAREESVLRGQGRNSRARTGDLFVPPDRQRRCPSSEIRRRQKRHRRR